MHDGRVGEDLAAESVARLRPEIILETKTQIAFDVRVISFSLRVPFFISFLGAVAVLLSSLPMRLVIE